MLGGQYTCTEPVMGGQYTGRLDLTNIDSLSNLLWGPPPPYSHPESTGGQSSRPGSGSGDRVTPQDSPARSQSRMSRTTKSGILIENGSGVTNVGSGLQSDSGGASSNYDDTVDSAMHIYEKLRRSRSGSLPSRRVKKNRHIASSTSSHSLMSGHAEPRSVTSRQHQNLSSESQNLSALNLSRAEELRTAKDLEEIKRALLALQHNSLGILGNIQFDHSVYAEGNNPSLAEFPALRLDSGAPPSTHPGHKPKKTRGPGVQYRCTEPVRQTTGPTFLRSPRKTTSTTNLINSGTESDNSYGVTCSASGGSRTSSILSSPSPTNYITNQVSIS